MKLWLLRPQEDLEEDDNPWRIWYDKVFGFVVRAENEEEARALITDDDWGSEVRALKSKINPWIDPHYSRCEELTAKGDVEIIMRDCYAVT